MTTAIDLLPYLSGIEQIRASKLTPEQKQTILKEMLIGLPSRHGSVRCAGTREIIVNLLEEEHGRTQSTPQKVSPKTKNPPKQSKTGKVQLLRDADGDGGRKTASARVVNKATKERGSP